SSMQAPRSHGDTVPAVFSVLILICFICFHLFCIFLNDTSDADSILQYLTGVVKPILDKNRIKFTQTD
ncbi:MAG: hypothetical protein IJY35_01085, partial [Clostridia bacterium]|nr:hypothetical protein [Clostridia bacterium]